jgi:MerR family mercuric resistance operon transcriptional regulator
MSFTIGELSRRTGVNAETIRYYERLGLLGPVARSESGRRLFDASDLESLLFIRHCREMLFSIEQIRRLLPMRDKGPCSGVKTIASAHLSELRTQLQTLTILEGKLAAVVAQCPDNDSAECSILRLLRDPEKSLGSVAG